MGSTSKSGISREELQDVRDECLGGCVIGQALLWETTQRENCRRDGVRPEIYSGRTLVN